ncbi:MAG TPA: hypothetical protein VGR55_00495 [Candidatus Acidoferrum sp.]|nr:hypothetical protein [Candidatus Acidoferrum sp.]
MIATPQPPPRILCHGLHIERAQQGFTMCVDCRRPLFPYPKNKCKAHGVYCCSAGCFTLEQIAEFAWERNGDYYHARDVEDTPIETAQSKKGTIQ